jgi:putative ABC transport system permease protein
MLRNSFKITFRNLSRNKAFSFINIFGLAIGLATCLLILFYIFDEASYDMHHKDVNRIYRIASESRGET